MDKKIYEPIKIVFTHHGQTYTVENIDWDADADEVLEEFKGLMIASGFPPTILNDDYGRWEWHEED